MPVADFSNEPSEQTPAPDEVGQADIDALLNAAGATADDAEASADSAQGDTAPAEGTPPDSEPDTRLDSLGRPFDETAAAMQAAIEEEQTAAATAAPPPPSMPPQPSVPPPPTKPFELSDLSPPANLNFDAKRVTMLNDVNLRVKIELGRTRMLVEDVLKLDEGSVVELDKLAGDPVDVFVNDRLIARGEVLVLNDNFCVRISEVLSHDPHRVSA
ncbi:MAG: flagellar motor switch protein FliN [Phycisphaerae bacterium]